ncbi:KAP family P-loop NTPase fold protein [Bifidobacterium asteroides]|uniref:KAP family P-loop NTPase fold protein n=1 Tax=Bifidobacterium asteroides TaxID=1684 RepID=UPI003A7FEE1E
MSEHSELYPSFLQDEPIGSAADDRYNRSKYVRNLALSLSRFPGSESLVVGIQGPWGSGKTSLKNMLVEQLVSTSSKKGKGKKQEEKVIVVEFEPWIYSGSGRLVTLLFNQISLTLLGKLGPVRHNIANFCKRAANDVAPISGLAPARVQMIAKAFGNLGEALEPDNQDIDRLSERRKDLKEKLEESATRIVVFIDDLDRLMDDEVTDVMRAVKAVGDLPYMTYVLLYDRDSVTKSLDKSCHGKGDEYLKKIIQVPIGMPELPQEVVYDRLKDGLTGIIGEKRVEQIYEKVQKSQFGDRSLPIYDACVKPFVRTMRDANRLINEFMLCYQVLRDDVEPMDLLGITSLEVFNPDLHRWIMASKDYLCDSDLPIIGRLMSDHKVEVKAHLSTLPTYGTDAKDRDLRAVESLFPFVAYCVGSLYTRPDEVGRAIHRPEHFNTYFRLSIGNNLIHEAEYRKLLVDDSLGERDLDDEHWLIISSKGFSDEPAKYLGVADAGRCALVVGFCLELEARHRVVYPSCISHDVATAIMKKDYTGERSEAIVQAIVDSNSPVSMIVAACIVYEIRRAIHRAKNPKKDTQEQVESKPTVGLMNHVAMFDSLPFCQDSEDIEDSGLERSLMSLCEKLKCTNSRHLQTPLSGWLLQWYASAIPLIFNKNDDRYKAFSAFQDLVDETKFVDYVLYALIQEQEDGRIVDAPLLKRFITRERIQTSLKLWDNDPDSIGDIKLLAAYDAAYKSNDHAKFVDNGEVDFLVENWKHERHSDSGFDHPLS